MEDHIFSIENIGNPNNLPPFSDMTQTFRDGKRIVCDPIIFKPDDPTGSKSFAVAGPAKKIYFDPAATRAAIVTCGGLCPGLNAVIRSLVLQLVHRYGVNDIVGIRYGYGGLSQEGFKEALPLTPKVVENIHDHGGTMLGSSRGAPNIEEMVDTLQREKINILFTIGGDGTMRGATEICREIQNRQLPISVIGIPKTIDNDIPYVRRSFGFESAVDKACEVITAAHEEARGAKGGIGLVKLMGRHAGYIAANATLATGHVNFCLVPEVPFQTDGPQGLFPAIKQRLQNSGHAVIVVAEGCGQEHFQNTATDASGNSKLGDIGLWLKSEISSYLQGSQFTLKYIDPSYIIRSSPASANDRLFCSRLAQNAVHAAMAGKTNMLIGYWHGQMTFVPLRALADKTKQIDREGELWFNVLETTGQPNWTLEKN